MTSLLNLSSAATTGPCMAGVHRFAGAAVPASSSSCTQPSATSIACAVAISQGSGDTAITPAQMLARRTRHGYAAVSAHVSWHVYVPRSYQDIAGCTELCMNSGGLQTLRSSTFQGSDCSIACLLHGWACGSWAQWADGVNLCWYQLLCIILHSLRWLPCQQLPTPRCYSTDGHSLMSAQHGL